MSSDTTNPETDAQPLEVQTVRSSDFISRLIEMTRATAWQGAPAFQLLIKCRSNTGTAMYLEAAPGTFLRFEDKGMHIGLEGIRSWTIDSEAAHTRMEQMMDWLADVLWHRVMEGEELAASDGVFLNHWVGLRTRPHHLSMDEAELLFGEGPRLSADSGSLEIEWEAPERLVGSDPDFKRRKETAKALFDRVTQDNAERFAGAIFAAFLQTWQHVNKH